MFDGLYEFCQLYTGGSIGSHTHHFGRLNFTPPFAPRSILRHIDGAMKLNHGLVDVAVNWAGGV